MGDPRPSTPAHLLSPGRWARGQQSAAPLHSRASLRGHVGRPGGWGRPEQPPAALWRCSGHRLLLLPWLLSCGPVLALSITVKLHVPIKASTFTACVFSPFSFQENTLAQHQACSRSPSKSWMDGEMGAWWVGGWIERKDFSCFQRWRLSLLCGPQALKRPPQSPSLSLWPHPHAPFQLLSPTLTVSPVRCSDSAGCLAGPGSNRCHWAVSLLCERVPGDTPFPGPGRACGPYGCLWSVPLAFQAEDTAHGHTVCDNWPGSRPAEPAVAPLAHTQEFQVLSQ